MGTCQTFLRPLHPFLPSCEMSKEEAVRAGYK